MQIYLLLTEQCNLNCKMCIRERQVGTDLDYEKLKNSEWLSRLGEHDIVLTGGEPSLHKDFFNIVKLMTIHAKTVTITTNGTINSYLSADLLSDNLSFQVSLDGDNTMHDTIRGVGSYEKTMETIELLNAYNAKYSVASVVNKRNAVSMKCLEARLRELSGLKYWRISYEMPFGSAGFDDMFLSEEWNCFVDEIIDIAQLRVRIKKIFPFEVYDRRRDELDAIYSKNRCNNCGSGLSKIYIYPDWTVYSCTCLTDFPLGNLLEQTLNEILSGKNIDQFKNYKCINPVCKACKYYKYCNGGCIGMSYHYFRKLGMGDIRCPILREQE